jgi:hypothetical protein
MKTCDYTFKVNCLEAGQRGPYQDSFYSYEVTSERSEYEVKAFCMYVLKKSYPKADMPDPFTGELLEFTNITKNKPSDPFSIVENTYKYRVRNEYTG